MPTSAISIEVRGQQALVRALRLFEDAEAPFLREAMNDAGQLLERAAESRAPGGIANRVEFVGTRGSGPRIRALIKVRHPGAKSMEFGRKKFYRGFVNRRQRSTGQAFQASPGQRPRPFVGIRRGDHAIGAVRDDVERRLKRAFEQEWNRVAAG